VFKGYKGLPEATAEAFVYSPTNKGKEKGEKEEETAGAVGGWFKTGDLAWLHKGG
jgi:long-subunit acyl-CoA synthetase (AMP-forming)